MLVKLTQLENAESPIEVTLLPMVTLVKLLQLKNAERPIDVTLAPIVMLLRLTQPQNVDDSMEVTPSGMPDIRAIDKRNNPLKDKSVYVTITPKETVF